MRKNVSVLLVMLLISSVFVVAQPIEIRLLTQEGNEKKLGEIDFFSNASYEEWNRTFGASNIDIGHCVQQTTDGGYIIVGYTRSYGTTSGRNIWLIKTDNSGNELWNKTFGGNDDDEAESVQQTADGGYIIAGYTKSSGAGLKDVILIKTDGFGNGEWTKTFGGIYDEEGYSVLQTTDGGYIVAGATSSFAAGGRDVWLIKTNAAGSTEWTRSLGGLASDGARSIYQTSDGGYILTGWTYSQGPGYLGNVWLVKTNTMGYEEWNMTFGGTGVDRGHSVQQTYDGGYIITGYTDSFGSGLYDAILIKTDITGNQEWMKTFGGSGRDYGHDVQQTTDGGYIIVGYTLSYGSGSDDIWFIKTDTSGNELYNKTYGGTSSDVGYSVQQTTDGGYIIVGHTLSYGAGVHDVWLIKLTYGDISCITNINIDPNPQYAHNSLNISCVIADTVIVNQAQVILTNPLNITENISLVNNGNKYWYESIYTIIGNYTFFIWVNDTDGTICESEIHNFSIISDDIPPEIQDMTPAIGYHNQSFTFKALITDNAKVSHAYVTYWFDAQTPVNETMTPASSDMWMKTITIPPSTTMLYYSFSANDTSDNWNAIEIQNISLFEYPPFIVDVNQSIFDRGFRIMPGWDAYQEFIPTLDMLSHVELYMTKSGTPTGNVTVEIRKDNAAGTLLFQGSISPDDVSTSFPGYIWVSVDVGGVAVNTGETYVVVLKDAVGAGTHHNLQWGWCDSYPPNSGGPYASGWFYFRKDFSPSWSFVRDWDFTFKTYGY